MKSSPFAARSSSLRRTPLAASLALALSMAGAAPAALAAVTGGGTTLVVANCNDTGFGSLRAALGSAMNGDTVDLSQLSCTGITLNSVVTTSADNLTIKASPGTKYGSPSITGATSNTSGLIRHTGTGLLTLEDMTLQGGKVSNIGPAQGGCIRSSGSVHMDHSVAKYCTAESTSSSDARGGAVFASSDVLLTASLIKSSKATAESGDAKAGGVFAGGMINAKYSSIRNNEAVSVSGTSSAGGLYADHGSIDNTTISGNTAEIIGGLMLGPTNLSVKIENSTISGNLSTGNASTGGAWVSVFGNTVTLENNTITDNVNEFNSGAGLWIGNQNSSVTLTSNIISGNRVITGVVNGETKYADSDLAQSSSTTIIGSNNLVGAIDANVVLPVDTIKQIDTPLGPLQDNGGALETHAIGTGSWAFNLGTTVDNGTFDGPESKDQRGEDRNVGVGVDIGAVESDALFLGRFEDPPTF